MLCPDLNVPMSSTTEGCDTFTKSVRDLNLNLICDLKYDLKIYECLHMCDLCSYYVVLK